MKKVKMYCLLLLCCFVLFSCRKAVDGNSSEQDSTSGSAGESTQGEDGEIILNASGGGKLSFLPPSPFGLNGEENPSETENSVTLTDSGSSLDTLTVYLLAQSEDYSKEDAKEELDHYINEYVELAEDNNGKVVEENDAASLKENGYTVQYASITYTLDGQTSYCARFYGIVDSYFLTGIIRSGDDTAEKFKLKTLLEELFQTVLWVPSETKK